MPSARILQLCLGVGVHRGAWQGWQAWRGARVLYSSGPGKELSSNVTRREQQQGSGGTQDRTGRIGLTDHRVSKLERYILVWGGKYKSLAEVPDLVSQDAVERARNKARIKINIMMVIVTLFACIGMIYSGKMARNAGHSVAKINEDWHKKVNEEYRKSLEENKKE